MSQCIIGVVMQKLSDLQTGKCDGVRHLALREGLSVFPEEILRLSDTLEILDLSGNRLRSLPDSFERLSRLRIAFFSFNDFETFPEVLGRCPSLEMIGFKSNLIAHVPENALPERLRWLILTDNRLRSLPGSLGLRPRLQKLMLSCNRLERLPDLSRCESLELVRVANNALSCVPDELLLLPRLSWLAFSGNPFCAKRRSGGKPISWNDLSVGEKVGEGASGIVYRASPKNSAKPRDVALKIFKGPATSDGCVRDEIFATFAAGSHPNLLPALGRLVDHPDGADGLVLDLVPPGFHGLAAPPSFESCTRDVYDGARRPDDRTARKIFCAMSSALASLHDRGISHGDFYAHNILVNGEGDAILGDFGAAGFLGDLPAHQADAMIEVERRALRVLESELFSATITQ